MKKNALRRTGQSPALHTRVREILAAAQTGIARTVNTTQVVANWLVGREIVEAEQQGAKRAEYGKQIVEELAARLQDDFGKGYSALNLWLFRRFYLEYPELTPAQILYAPRKESGEPTIRHAVGDKSEEISTAVRAKLAIRHTLDGESWRSGQLHTNLSWTHYRALLRVEKAEARSFYEIEAIQNNWAARELERQINSLLYERLALSRDKRGLLRLARKGQEIQGPLDVFKDPLVLEFLKIPASAKLVESALEEALLNQLIAYGHHQS